MVFENFTLITVLHLFMVAVAVPSMLRCATGTLACIIAWQWRGKQLRFSPEMNMFLEIIMRCDKSVQSYFFFSSWSECE